MDNCSKKGKILTITNKELEKLADAHSDDINIFNDLNRILCPTQTDLKKFQRTECRAVTDSDKIQALVRALELTTSADPRFITRKFPMPSYSSQEALAYIDTITNACVFFHADNGKLWIAQTRSPDEMSAILANPNFKNLN